MSNLTKNEKNTWVMDTPESRVSAGYHIGAISIPAAELRVGMQLVTKWNRDGTVAKSTPITDKNECEGQWRTHVHINKSNCYDGRIPVWVKS